MEDNLCIEVNTPDSKMYMPLIEIKHIGYENCYLKIGKKQIFFNFKDKRFDTSLSLLKITNNREKFKEKNFVKLETIVFGEEGDAILEFGKYKEVFIVQNLIVSKRQKSSDVIAVIMEEGIYTPEAKSPNDDENRIDGFMILPKSHKPKIWKVSA